MPKVIEYKKGQVIGTSDVTFSHDVPHKIGTHGEKIRFACFICPLCGTEFETRIADVKADKVRSCGCLHEKIFRSINTFHGLRYHRLYPTWLSMKDRCLNPNSEGYPGYGGRGITVCQAWIDDFKVFYDYVTKLPHYGEEGRSLDRIKNNNGYEPGNVRWATNQTQTTNSRRRIDNKSGYTGIQIRGSKYFSTISVMGVSHNLGTHKTLNGAVAARNNHIRENNLTDYKIQEIT